jgi:hypothetical protein
MHRILLKTILPAVAVVPLSYCIARSHKSVAPPVHSTPNALNAPVEPIKESPIVITVDELEKIAEFHKNNIRIETNKNLVDWFQTFDDSLISCVETLDESFANELTFIHVMHNGLFINSLNKYSLTNKLIRLLKDAKTEDETRIVKALVKYYHIL